MKMARILGGMVAGVVGVAFGAGSALAYTTSDPAPNKLVPYYEVGGTLATIIGVQNLESGADLATPPDDALENLVLSATAYDADGMQQASTQLCLAENQFGYVVLQESAATEGQEIEHRGRVLSMADEDAIADTGYVKIEATHRVGACSVGFPRPAVEPVCITAAAEECSDADATPAAIAAWTIMQDVGAGFFGTEIPTVTDNAAGLMAEGAMVDVRYDINPANESMTDIYVWLQAGEDTDATSPNTRRHLEVTVHCEDGTTVMVPDTSEGAEEGAMTSTIRVAAPGRVTVIDPAAAETPLGEATAMCLENEGDQGRGVLSFAIPAHTPDPDVEAPGMVWSHITQMGMSFRMNFTGYH